MDHDIDALKDLLGTNVSNELVKFLLIILVLMLTWTLRWLVTKILPHVVRFLSRSTRSTLDEELVMVLHPPIRFVIGTMGIWVSLILLGISGTVIDQLMASLVAVAIFWSMYRAVDLVVELLHRMLQYSKISEATLLDRKITLLTRQVAKGVVAAFAVVVIMEKWNYNVGGLLAGLGLGGLAVALAAQDALANLISYFMILADEPFLIGEHIVAGEINGIVEGIGFRSTRIRVLDQSLVVVPNKMMGSEAITNWSRLTKRRLNMTLSLAYGSSPNQVLLVVQAIREMLKGHELVHSDSVVVQFSELGDNSLDLIIICFMKTPTWNEFQAAKQDINLKILTILTEYRVENANPSYDIVVKQKPGLAEQMVVQEFLPPPQAEPSPSAVTDSPVPDDTVNQ